MDACAGDGQWYNEPSFNVMTGTTFHVNVAVPEPEIVAVASLLVLLEVIVPPFEVQ